MANVLIDSTYYVDTPGATTLAWPQGARVSQVRIFGADTTAAAIFTVAGTPILRWAYVLQAGSATAASEVENGLIVIPMGNVRFPTAWAPSTLTACTAWIDFS
jgi:hypothetical protein